MREMQPDAQRSLHNYRRLAKTYDACCARIMRTREQAIALMELKPGEVVVDIGSGTGLSFPLLVAGVGSTGRVIAIEHSPEMMALARKRVQSAGWSNVTLIEAPAETADIDIAFDAILFHYTHDVLQSRGALARIFARAKPGARIAVAGAKFTSWWMAPLNLWLIFRTRHYLTTYAGLGQPWGNLLRYVPNLVVRSRRLGTAYLAHGRSGAIQTGTEPRS